MLVGLFCLLIISSIISSEPDDAEHYNLRGKLNKAGAPVLIATANEVSSFFTDYKSAFFDGFKILYIRPVGERAIDSVLGQDVERGRFTRLWEYVPRTIRSLLVVSGIVASSANADVDLEKLVDCFHLYYQAKYDAFVIQIQRLLSVLAMADEGVGIERNQGNDRTRERANISVFENDDRSKNRGERGEKPKRGEISDNRSVVSPVVE